MWLRPCWSRCEDRRRASVISATPAARDKRRLDNDTAWRQSVLPIVVQFALQIGVQTLMQTCPCKSMCTLLWTPFCARVCRRMCAPFYLPLLHATNAFVCIRRLQTSARIVRQTGYPTGIQSSLCRPDCTALRTPVARIVCRPSSGHIKGQLLRRCQTTDAATKSCVEIDDIARARIHGSHGSHSQGCLHSCAEWCINE